MSEPHEEFQELHERAEQGEHKMAEVSLTMAVLAVVVAFVTLMGHRAHTEEVLLQNKVTDQWNYYQAKRSQVESNQRFLDQLAVIGAGAEGQQATQKNEALKKMAEKYEAAMEHEKDREAETQSEARKLEDEFKIEQRRANRFDLAEGLLEAALVIASITLLTRHRGYWIFGTAVAAAGIAVAGTAFFIRI